MHRKRDEKEERRQIEVFTGPGVEQLHGKVTSFLGIRPKSLRIELHIAFNLFTTNLHTSW